MLGHATGRLLLRRDGYKVNLDAVLRAAAQHGLAAGNALDGYLGARASVGRWIDGDGIGQLRRVLRGLLPIAAVAAHRFNAE